MAADRSEFIAGDAGYGPLAAADEAHQEAFTPTPGARKPWRCVLGMHSWRIEDGDDFINRLTCADCGKTGGQTRG